MKVAILLGILKGLDCMRSYLHLILFAVLISLCLEVQSDPLTINDNIYPCRKEKGPGRIELYKTPHRGPGEFRWYKNLEPGFYTIKLDIQNGQVRRDFVVSVDFDAIGIQTAYFTDTGKETSPPYSYDFNITQPGVHIISIRRFPFFMWPGEEEILKINKIAIEKRKKPKVWDVYDYHHPGQSYNLMWGWHASSSYQRPKNRKLTREYWDKRIIEEPAKWGSNYLQLYPYYSERFLREGDFSQAVAFAHENGFLVDQHSSLKRNLIRAGSGSDYLDEYLNEGAENVFGKLFDRTNKTWAHSTDGFDSEERHHVITQGTLYGKENVIKVTNKIWEYFPGCFVSECFNLAGTGRGHYENILHMGYHGPNYGKVLMCAGAPFRNGLDDFMGIDPFPLNRAFKNEYNWVFRNFQADSRPYSNNKFGGISMTDWIAKECSDFFRANAYAIRENRQPIASALSWLGEPSTNLPEIMRKNVYALSMDPCRSALAYPLATTGRNGLQFWNYPRQHVPKFVDGTGEKALKRWQRRFAEYLQREYYPAHTIRQHNGIIAVNHYVMADHIDLVWDTENLGQFDINASKLTLINDLFRLEVDKTEKIITKHKLDAVFKSINTWSVSLEPGLYNLQVKYDAELPKRVEIWYCSNYLGTIEMDGKGNRQIPFYVSDNLPHNIDFKLIGGTRHSFLDCRITKADNRMNVMTSAGVPDDRSTDLKTFKPTSDKKKVQLRKALDLMKKDHEEEMPAGLQSERMTLPTAIDFWFDARAGSYLLCIRAKSQKKRQRLDITLNNHRFSDTDVSMQDALDENAWVMTKNNWYREYGLYGKIGELMLDKNWQTLQLPVVLVHDGGSRRHKIELSIPPGSEQVDFDYISLVKMPIDTDITQMGGNLSVLKEKTEIEYNGSFVEETRTWRLAADEPSLFLNVEKSNRTGLAVKNSLDIKDYEKITFDRNKVPIQGHTKKIPKIITLVDIDKIMPTLTIMLNNTSSIEKIKWDKETISFCSSKSTHPDRPIQCMITLRDKFDRSMPVGGPRVVTWNNSHKETEFTNPFNHRSSILVKVKNPQKGPYFACESGWWSVRGAQTVCEDSDRWDNYIQKYNEWLIEAEPGSMPKPPVDYDLVRCIAEPRKKIKLQRYGYIKDIVRPGWGCQKQLIIKDIRPDKCIAKVLNVSAYLFAPRVIFKQDFDTVRLNGKPWAYHDGRNVFLPQKTGEYQIKVSRKKKSPALPTLTSTAARVDSAVYKDNLMTIKISKPDYVFKIPENLNYKLGLKYNPKRFKIDAVEGGKLLREGPLGGIVDCYDNIIRIQFIPK